MWVAATPPNARVRGSLDAVSGLSKHCLPAAAGFGRFLGRSPGGLLRLAGGARRVVELAGFVAPGCPVWPILPAEEFEVRPVDQRFDHLVRLLGFLTVDARRRLSD